MATDQPCAILGCPSTTTGASIAVLVDRLPEGVGWIDDGAPVEVLVNVCAEHHALVTLHAVDA